MFLANTPEHQQLQKELLVLHSQKKKLVTAEDLAKDFGLSEEFSPFFFLESLDVSQVL
jgi:hypothetical protein